MGKEGLLGGACEPRSPTACTQGANPCGSGTCVPLKFGRYMCSCADGYELGENGKCVDIDECTTRDVLADHTQRRSALTQKVPSLASASVTCSTTNLRRPASAKTEGRKTDDANLSALKTSTR